ncbi:MAG: hypothetical protein UU09_C0042G0005 [Microgenomates group bacterium GW2011_GWA2_40_6]|nr:MAG: hypothetical protein UU09_C0042G0005 [Microgenomates group bacterium GW2011_GWA2_40_6]
MPIVNSPKDVLNASGLTYRQLNGQAYFQEGVEKLPVELEGGITGENLSIHYHGKAMDPQELEDATQDVDTLIALYDLDRLEISSNTSGKTLNLIEITPTGWGTKRISSSTSYVCSSRT